MRYSSLRHKTRTRDLVDIIIRTATFVVCVFIRSLCVAARLNKVALNTALGATESPFCNEGAHRGVSARERLFGVRFHTGK
jgi:hypothetical protein